MILSKSFFVLITFDWLNIEVRELCSTIFILLMLPPMIVAVRMFWIFSLIMKLIYWTQVLIQLASHATSTIISDKIFSFYSLAFKIIKPDKYIHNTILLVSRCIVFFFFLNEKEIRKSNFKSNFRYFLPLSSIKLNCR